VSAAGLRGRGGAWFPVERKWRAALDSPAPRVLIANGAEDEPGSRKDRHLMAGQPHLVIDGALASAAAIGADTVRLYVNAHAAPALAAMRAALDAVLAAGLAEGVDIAVVEARRPMWPARTPPRWSSCRPAPRSRGSSRRTPQPRAWTADPPWSAMWRRSRTSR